MRAVVTVLAILCSGCLVLPKTERVETVLSSGRAAETVAPREIEYAR